MTLANCERLLAHFEKLSTGEGIPDHHKHKADVMKNAKERARLMKLHIDQKMKHKKYAKVVPKEEPKKEKKDGKR